MTTLSPGSCSALHHSHTKQEEFIYILEGNPTLFYGQDAQTLYPGMIFGFPKGGLAHHLSNDTNSLVSYLEIGNRISGDYVEYPNDDLKAKQDNDGNWVFTHKNDLPYT